MIGKSSAQIPSSDSSDGPITEISPAGVGSPHVQITNPLQSSSDDLNQLLAQTIPDPFLAEGPPDEPISRKDEVLESEEGVAATVQPLAESGSLSELRIDGSEPTSFSNSLSMSSESELGERIHLTPSSDGLNRDRRGGQAWDQHNETDHESREASRGVSWLFVLIASYSSALTIALLWIYFSGRGFPRGNAAPTSAVEVELPGLDVGKNHLRSEPKGSEVPALPSQKLLALGESRRIGDLEITPVSADQRAVKLIHLNGSTGRNRWVNDVLVLRLNLKNCSTTQTLTPIEPRFLRDLNPDSLSTFLRMDSGERLPMIRLAEESEWSIQDQVFTSLAPGEEMRTIIVSEPVGRSRLTTGMTWYLQVSPEPLRSDVIGVQLKEDQIRWEDSSHEDDSSESE